MEKIIRNSAKCLKCGDELISTHRHDFKRCSCGTIGVDGGQDYRKRMGYLVDIEETSVIESEEIKEVE